MCNCGSNSANTLGSGLSSPSLGKSSGINKTFQQIKQTRDIVKKMWEDAGQAGHKPASRKLDQFLTYPNKP